MRALTPLPALLTLAALVRLGAPTEETCQRECALPERQNLCPSDIAPVEHYKGWATEGPGGLFDLKYTSLTFTPCPCCGAGFAYNGQGPYGDTHAYTVRGERIAELPDNITNATSSATSIAGVFDMTTEDNYTAVILGKRTNGRFRFYGKDYGTLFVSTNGFVTLGDGDPNPHPGVNKDNANPISPNSLKRHFLMPRISGLFTDLDPHPVIRPVDDDDDPEAAKRGQIHYHLKQLGSPDERLVVTYDGMYDVRESLRRGKNQKLGPFQITVWLNRSTITLSYLEVNATDALVGLSPGEGVKEVRNPTSGVIESFRLPGQQPLGFDQRDLSATDGCAANANCTSEGEVRPKCKMLTSADRSRYLCPDAVARPIGPTRPPDTRPHPYRTAVQDPNPHSQYCQLGCTYYFANSTGSSVARCHEMCDWTYRYDVTVGYNDLAEVARYECRDGCEIANLRCQPGYYCAEKEMRVCEAGSYRDNDYEHTLECVDCPRGRYREFERGRYMETCSKCPIGKYVNVTGADHITDCLRCPAGTFADEPGRAFCLCITPMSCMGAYEDLAEMKGSEPYIGRF